MLRAAPTSPPPDRNPPTPPPQPPNPNPTHRKVRPRPPLLRTERRPSLFSQRIDEVCTSVVAMATSSRKYSVPALHLCICSVVILCLLTKDVTADMHRQPEVVASTEAFYLRGNPSVKAEPEESYESFERRELAEYYDPSANCSANCDVP